MRKLRRKKVHGIDELPLNLLKDVANEISKPNVVIIYAETTILYKDFKNKNNKIIQNRTLAKMELFVKIVCGSKPYIKVLSQGVPS